MSQHPDDKRLDAPAAAGKPTLESLLRLKRAERPDAVFWEEFDRGLREKQLAAIIEPRPWWLGLALLGRRLVPAGLPVSAAAAALLAVMVVRTHAPFGGIAGPVEFGPDLPPAQPVAAAVVVAATTPEAVPAAPAAHNPSTSLPPERIVANTPTPARTTTADALKPTAQPMLATAPSPAANPAPEAARAVAEPLVPALLELPPLASAPAPTASQLAIARNLATVRSEAPELLPSAAGALSADAESADSGDSLQMVVRNPRHARVLLAMAGATEVEGSAGLGQVRERLTHRLGSDETRLGSASRLGVGGDRFSLSF